MSERPWNPAPGATPRNRAALYAQAQLRTPRYGDFSASRQNVEGQFAHREWAEMVTSTITEQAPEIAPPSLAPSPEPSLEPSPELSLEPSLEPSQAPSLDPPPNRWYALQSVLFPTPAVIAAEHGQRPPTVAVLSAAGGVGKTCLVATLGRVLSGLAEQVLLVDLSAFALLPFYFASREVKPGVVRTFSSPGPSDAPVRLLSLDVERYSAATGEPDPLLGELVHRARGVSRVLMDVGVAHRGLRGRLLALRSTILAPILPDMSSLAGLASLEALVGGGSQIFYLLNQFDDSLPLHVDVRAMLQQQLGNRLLPLVLHRSPAVSEALAEGITVIDYAPASQVAEDYRQLAVWLRNLSAPATVSDGGMRWTER